MSNGFDRPAAYVDPVRLGAGRVLATEEQEGGEQAALRPLHRLGNAAIAEAAAGGEISASWRPGVFVYDGAADPGPVLSWPVEPPTDKHASIRIVFRGVQEAGGTGEIYARSYNGLVEHDRVKWTPPGVAAPLLVARPPRSEVLTLSTPLTFDGGGNRLPLFVEVGIDPGDDGDVHARGLSADWPALEAADLDGSVAINGVWPFGTDDSIDPGRPYPSCRARQATEVAEETTARLHRSANYAALAEPIPTYTAGAAAFSAPPLGLVHATTARPIGQRRPVRFRVSSTDADGGTVTMDGPAFAVDVAGVFADQGRFGEVGEGARLLSIDGMPIGLLRLSVTSNDSPGDVTCHGVRVGKFAP